MGNPRRGETTHASDAASLDTGRQTAQKEVAIDHDNLEDELRDKYLFQPPGYEFEGKDVPNVLGRVRSLVDHWNLPRQNMSILSPHQN